MSDTKVECNEVEVEEEVSEEFKVKDLLEKERKNIKSMKDLIEFLKKINKEYNYGYGTAPRAIAQAALATAWYLSGEFGITGFQASFVMWDFVRDWMCPSNKCGLKLVDFDKMLYPQYEEAFDKVVSNDTWKALQEQAKINLDKYYRDKNFTAHPDVVEHWKFIVEGNVPFGYSVQDR